MRTRNLLAAAAGIALCLAGCSAPDPALGGTTATVSIDGDQINGSHPVRCHQAGWAWYIETPDENQGFSAILETGGPVTAKSVQFRDFGGFTGSFWVDNVGEAEATGANGSYTITGTADGNFTDKPSEAVSARFRIQADC
ncbi:lipoprotein LpqH [Mycobacterium sp. SMC-4]|uniref:lipoprotein LpqH n=1 Tax=Mycobacterium sp. SMC-4 TaxID=2857059 RepID=UPI0021B2E298|nr:lipoprotein LpqH [Mycobacterium sp. SMC-4]UXA16008.1 lipoprotein LpqH [Mycobacterium sp. SMC-4]